MVAEGKAARQVRRRIGGSAADGGVQMELELAGVVYL
jgi:hypothetical protein